MTTSSEAESTNAGRELPPEPVPRFDPIPALQAELRTFAAERNWESYHTPRNLAALIATEAGELLAHFRWEENALDSRSEEVRHELADVFLGVLRFADVAGIDLVRAAREKLAVNAVNYPVQEESTGPGR